MKTILKNELKPIYYDFKIKHPHEFSYYQIKWFDERIDTLTKSEVIDLYKSFLMFKKGQIADWHIIGKVECLYDTDGWFRKRLIITK